MNKDQQQVQLNANSISYSSDNPIEHETQDMFARLPFSNRIAETIATRNDPRPLAIAIYGKWGEGKTSVLNLIQNCLKPKSNIICMRFNPWRFNDEVSLLINFFNQLSQTLQKSITNKKEQIGKLLEEYSGCLIPEISFGELSVSLGDNLQNFGRVLSTVDLEEKRERIETILGDAHKTVCVIMDDIDRLEKDEIHLVFRLVKLTADFKNMVYLLAFDHEMVSAAIGERFGEGNKQAGKEFLEKIIQIPLDLPKASPIDLRKLAFSEINLLISREQLNLNDRELQEFTNSYVDGLEPNITTPRLVHRYINALKFTTPMVKGEVNIVDHLLMQGIRVFYPNLYLFIHNNSTLFLGRQYSRFVDSNETKDKIIDSIRTFVESNESSDSNKQEAALVILRQLFPRLQNINYSGDYDRIWAEKKKIASTGYFERYFTLTVKDSDLSDNALSRFIEELNNKTADNITEAIRILVRNNAEKFILKLELRVSEITGQSAADLAIAVAQTGDLYPDSDVFNPFDNPFYRGAQIVAKLTSSVSQPIDVAKQIIANGQPIPFCHECAKSLMWFKTKHGTELFTDAQREELISVMATSIRNEAANTVLYLSYPKYAPQLFSTWAHKNKQEVTEYLENSFKTKDTNVVDFLGSFVGFALEMESGIQRRGDFERRNYDSVCAIANPDTIYKQVKNLYKSIDTSRFPHDLEPPQLQLVTQFAYIHEHVKKEEAKTPDDDMKQDGDIR